MPRNHFQEAPAGARDISQVLYPNASRHSARSQHLGLTRDFEPLIRLCFDAHAQLCDFFVRCSRNRGLPPKISLANFSFRISLSREGGVVRLQRSAKWPGKHPRSSKCRSAWKSTCMPAPPASKRPRQLHVRRRWTSRRDTFPISGPWPCRCPPSKFVTSSFRNLQETDHASRRRPGRRGRWRRSAVELRMSGLRGGANRSSRLQSTQASIAISADGEHWFLINASPDLRQQLIATPQLHPRAGKLRHSPISGVILTNGEIDAVAGLLSMREGSPFTIYAHAKVLSILGDNSIFNVLNEKNVERQPIEIDRRSSRRCQTARRPASRSCRSPLPGKSAWYLEGKAHPGGRYRRRRHAGAYASATRRAESISILSPPAPM